MKNDWMKSEIDYHKNEINQTSSRWNEDQGDLKSNHKEDSQKRMK